MWSSLQRTFPCQSWKGRYDEEEDEGAEMVFLGVLLWPGRPTGDDARQERVRGSRARCGLYLLWLLTGASHVLFGHVTLFPLMNIQAKPPHA